MRAVVKAYPLAGFQERDPELFPFCTSEKM